VCKNIGYTHVECEDEASRCSLCQTTILHETGTVYAVTIQEAQSTVRELVIESQVSKMKKSGNSRGLGVKRRVFNIIESLIEMNRGRSVTIENVMRECSEAGIDLGRAMKYMDTLESEGTIRNDGVAISLTKEAWTDV
jgi:predicted transcriptional regulator